jgi:hypothetical protein
MKYKTKPTFVDAIPCRELIKCAQGNWAGLPRWMLLAYEAGSALFMPTEIRLIALNGNQGTVIANIGDMVLHGAGAIYPMAPGDFNAQFEPAE